MLKCIKKWKFLKKKGKVMEKIESKDPKTSDFLYKELKNLKFQSLFKKGPSKTIREITGKNGKHLIYFNDGTKVDFKFLDDEYIKLAKSQRDFTNDQLNQISESRKNKTKKKIKSNPKGLISKDLNNTNLIKDNTQELISDTDIDIIETTEKENSSNSMDNKVSPVYLLLKKAKENKIKLNISIDISIPSKDLYKILSESFSNIENEISYYALSQISNDDIKKNIEKSIKEYYKDGK